MAGKQISDQRPMFIIFGGLSGVGKTTIARELARQLGAVYVRIDSIEQAVRDSGVLTEPLNDAGYRVGYAVAEDNLLLGHTVIADSVNPLQITRDAWMDVSTRAHVEAVEVEITCSDLHEHRRRVEVRSADIPGLTLPDWQSVVAREYQPWHRERIVLDTAGRSVAEVVKRLRDMISQQ